MPVRFPIDKSFHILLDPCRPTQFSIGTFYRPIDIVYRSTVKSRTLLFICLLVPHPWNHSQLQLSTVCLPLYHASFPDFSWLCLQSSDKFFLTRSWRSSFEFGHSLPTSQEILPFAQSFPDFLFLQEIGSQFPHLLPYTRQKKCLGCVANIMTARNIFSPWHVCLCLSDLVLLHISY